MKRAYYDEKPSVFQAVGNGDYLYHWDIQEEKITNNAGEDPQSEVVKYSCLETTISGEVSYDKCVEAVIRSEYGIDQEMAVINKYNSYKNGLTQDIDSLNEYNEFLQFVFDTKMMVKKDLEQEELLSLVKKKKINDISVYDKSNSVNSFNLNGLPVWLDKDTRVGLMNSTQIEKAAGHETTTLWLGSVSLVINCDLAIQLLSALELYALECYNKTAEHKANVGKLTSIEEVEAYDYTTGYPDKLDLNTSGV